MSERERGKREHDVLAESFQWKADLLSRAVSLSAFLEHFLQLDQRYADRRNASHVSVMLHDPDIESFFEEHFENLEDFYAVRCLADFHLGQKHAFSAENEKAIAFFQQSLEDAQKTYVLEIPYIQGTIAFLKRDMRSLDECISRSHMDSIEDGRSNRNILLRMKRALDSQSELSYVSVYNSSSLE